MKLLLDTHVLIWLTEGMTELPPRSRRRIEEMTGGGLAVSSISFWEIAMLEDRGRVSLSVPIDPWRRRAVAEARLHEEPLDADILVHSVRLPGTLHGDPADRMLVATARLRDYQLATRDRRLLDYAAAGHLNAIEV